MTTAVVGAVAQSAERHVGCWREWSWSHSSQR